MTRFVRNLCWLVAGCGLARGAYLAALLNAGPEGAGRARILDSAVYWQMAETISGGDLAYGSEVYALGPLYGYWLAALRLAFGPVETPVLVLQQLFGLGTVYCVAQLGRRVFSESAGLVAGGLYGLYGAAAMLEGKVLASSLETFLLVFGFLLLVCGVEAWRAKPEGKRGARAWMWFGAAGLLLGLATISRANMLLVIPPMLGWILWRLRSLSVALVVGCVALGCLVPVALRNACVAGDAVLVSAQGGITFYQGNNPNADGTYSTVEEVSGDPAKQAAESRALAARKLGIEGEGGAATLKASAVSDYWFGRGLSYWKAQPWDSVVLLGKKLRYWFGSAELSTEYLLKVERELFPVIWLMPVPFGVIAAFAFLGAVGAFSPRSEWAEKGKTKTQPEDPVRDRSLVPLLLIPVGVSLLTVLMFYFSSRYRLMAVPFLCVFAGGGAALFWLRLKRNLPVLLWTGSAVAVAVFSLVSWGATERLQAASQFFNLANAQSKTERYAQAVSLYQRSLELDSRDYRTHYNLALHYLHLNQPHNARAELRKVLAQKPGFEPAKRYLANLPSE